MRGLLVIVALGCAAPVLAAPPDTLAPRIDHQPVTTALRNQPLQLRARITSPVGKAILEPTAFVRLPGIAGFSRIPLKPLPPIADLFAADIPGSLVTSDLDYYLEAFDADGNGPARAGDPDHPIHVKLTEPKAPEVRVVERPAQPSTTLVLTPPAPRSQGPTVALSVLSGIGAGVGAMTYVGFRLQRDRVMSAAAAGGAVNGRELNDGQKWGTASNIAFGASGLFLTLALTHALWPEDELPQTEAAK